MSTTTFLPEDTDWAQREWELRKKNEEVEERQRHTQDFYFVASQQEGVFY